MLRIVLADLTSSKPVCACGMDVIAVITVSRDPRSDRRFFGQWVVIRN